jgi:ABC-type branched-subunit amino acid transport system ATPase component
VTLRARYSFFFQVRLKGLRKVFGTHVAVNDLALDLVEGEIFSLLGHNGAGKSTTISMLTGVIPSDAPASVRDGGATIYGAPLRGGMAQIRKLMGVCPQVCSTRVFAIRTRSRNSAVVRIVAAHFAVAHRVNQRFRPTLRLAALLLLADPRARRTTARRSV